VSAGLPGVPPTNRAGQPCPPWCVTNHDEELIPGKPEHGYMDGHASEKRGHRARLGDYGALARAYAWPDGEQRFVMLTNEYGLHNINLGAEEARRLARLLNDLAEGKVTPAQLRKVAAALTATADLISPQDQP
jgi:hypothetical protein